MASIDGSAAVASATPQSAVIDSTRERLRLELPPRLARLQNILDRATGALDGPDPEAAFGYLELLDDHLQMTVSDLR